MIRVPPHVPPPIPPKEVGKEVKKVEERAARPKAPPKPGIARGPELDARAIAVRLAALATEAKRKEIAAEEFSRILEEVIKLTGLKEPEAAMAEASRRLQKEIEAELERIKANKELMEEAKSWQEFAELLSRMSAEHVEAFISLLKTEIRGL